MLHLGKQRENATLDALQNDSLSLWKWVSVFARENSNAGRKMSPGQVQVQVQIHSDEWGWNHEEHRVCGPRTSSLCPQELLKAARLCLPSAQLRPWQNTSSQMCKSWFNRGHLLARTKAGSATLNPHGPVRCRCMTWTWLCAHLSSEPCRAVNSAVYSALPGKSDLHWRRDCGTSISFN